MEDYQDHLSDIEQWAGMWDELQDDFQEDNPPVPEVEVNPQPLGDTQDTYWAFFNDRMENPSGDSDYDYDELLQEDKTEKTPNPVYPDSVGPDYKTTQPVWVSEELLSDVEDMKKKLFELENQIASKMGGGEKWVEKAHQPELTSTQNKIDALRDRITRVSNNLGTKDEPSPWRVDQEQ